MTTLNTADLTVQDIKDLFAETGRRFEASQQEWDKQITETKVQFAETDKRIDKQFAETNAVIKRLGKRIGDFGNNDGRIVEQEFFDALQAISNEVASIKFEELSPNYRRENKKLGIRLEIDVLLHNGTHIGIMETKKIMHLNDIEKVYNKLIPNSRKLLKEFADKKMMVIVASKSFNNDALQAAIDYGFVVMKPEGKKIVVIDQKRIDY